MILLVQNLFKINFTHCASSVTILIQIEFYSIKLILLKSKWISILNDVAQWAKLILNKFSTSSRIIDWFCIVRTCLKLKIYWPKKRFPNDISYMLIYNYSHQNRIDGMKEVKLLEFQWMYTNQTSNVLNEPQPHPPLRRVQCMLVIT